MTIIVDLLPFSVLVGGGGETRKENPVREQIFAIANAMSFHDLHRIHHVQSRYSVPSGPRWLTAYSVTFR